MYSISNSIDDAYKKSENNELKAEIYLSLCSEDPNSKQYIKTIKKISKFSRKHERIFNKSKDKAKLKEIENIINELISIRNDIVNAYLDQEIILVQKLISDALVSKYCQGLGIVDAFRGIVDSESSYGLLVYKLFEQIDRTSLLKKIFKKKRSYFDKLINTDKRLKNSEFLETEEGALLIESHFLIYLFQLVSEKLSEEEINTLLTEIMNEISKEDQELYKQVEEIYKKGVKVGQLSTIFLQIVRLSMGKGVFMNAAVRTTNIILRVFMKKGMTYAQNAVFRKRLAVFLGKRGWNIYLNIALFIPDLFTLMNKRDFLGVTSTIQRLYFLRSANNND